MTQKSSMSILFLVVLVDMIGFGIIIPFLTYMVAGLADPGQPIGRWVAALMAAYAGAMFLFSPFWGALSDRIGRRPVLMMGLAGNSIAFLVFGLSNSLWMALFARLFAGVVNANISVTRAYIGDISEPHEVARRQGILGAAFGVGFSIGPAIGGILSAPAEWTWTSAFVGTIFETHPYLLPCLASTILSSIGFLFATTKLEESLPKSARKMVEKRPPVQTLKTNITNIGKMYKRPVVSPILWSMLFFWIGFTIMHVVLILFTMMAVTDGGFGFSEQDNGWIFTFVGIVGIITQGRLIGPLSDRFGSSSLMSYGFLICGLGLATIPFVPPHLGLLGLLPVMALVAFGNSLVTPSNMTLLTHASGAKERGMIMGVSESLRALSSFAGVIIGGLVWDATVSKTGFFDFHTSFLLCGLFSLIAWIVFRFSNAYRAEDEILAAAEVNL
uniref:Major facilitator superfamily protein (TetA) n=2 Tax=environmental samples TaxID=68359 RepID=A0A075HG85_9EURY|nr:major facilitator superfamily MFS_1 (tetA) [uncultured marine group II/III euryarchaeote KM3_18_A05]AIF14964.1 major facilitator superfamily protein (tetA) [uncultured marine group II/III euryarchaeote KM3_69_A05]